MVYGYINMKLKVIFILAKRLTEKQKEEIIISFSAGEKIGDLAIKFNCTELTISRNLKKILGEEKFKELTKKNNLYLQDSFKEGEDISSKNKNASNNGLEFEKVSNQEKKNLKDINEEDFSLSSFMEITPLDCEIDNVPQKDLSSISIEEINFPNTVYLIVDKNIELETKYLRDYPDWQFLSNDELNRKTIEIHLDLKNARRLCKKEQKVIKVPNTDVFRIVSPILLSKGISRIVAPDKLIAL